MHPIIRYHFEEMESSDREGFPYPVLHDDPCGLPGAGRLFPGGQCVLRIAGQADAETVRRPESFGVDRIELLRPGGGNEVCGAGECMQFFDSLERGGHQNDPARLVLGKG